MSNGKYTEQVSYYTTPQQKKKVEREAKRLSMKVSDYVRRKIEGTLPPTPVASSQTAQ